MAPMENAAITTGMPFDEDMVSSLHSRSADTNDNIKRLQKKKNMLEKKFQSHQSTELKVSPKNVSSGGLLGGSPGVSPGGVSWDVSWGVSWVCPGMPLAHLLALK